MKVSRSAWCAFLCLIVVATDASIPHASDHLFVKRTSKRREKGQSSSSVDKVDRQLKKSKHKHGKSAKKKKHKGYIPHHGDIFTSPSTPSQGYRQPRPPTYYPHPNEYSKGNIYYDPNWWTSSYSSSKKSKSHKKGKSQKRHYVFGRRSSKGFFKRKPKDIFRCSPTMPPTQKPADQFPTAIPTPTPSKSVDPTSPPSVSAAPSFPPRPPTTPPVPTVAPTRSPQTQPPTQTPSVSLIPTNIPTQTDEPSLAPSFLPSYWPSNPPSTAAIDQVSDQPSEFPSDWPSVIPTVSAIGPTTVFPSTSLRPTVRGSSGPTLVPLVGWNQQGNAIDGADRSDLFGISVALSADSSILAAGGSLNDEGGTNAGHVRVLRFNETTREWSPMGKAIPGEQRLDRFGTSVALSFDGLILAASAPYHDGSSGPDSGHVRVFIYDDDAQLWRPLGNSIDGEAEGDESGTAIALSGDGQTVAIGSIRNRPDGLTTTGHVRVYRYDENLDRWTQQGSDLDGSREDDFWGCSVSLSFDGSTLAVGSQFFDANGINSGLVQVFNFNGQQWELYGNPIPGAERGDTFGTSVSLSASGRFLVGGARRGSGPLGETGHVRVFFYSIDSGSWRQVGETVSGKEEDEEFGVSVSMSADGSSFAVGASRSNNGAGVVRVYSSSSTFEWFQVGDDINGKAANDYSGSALALSPLSEVVAVGARFNDDIGTNAGQVRVYRNFPE